MSEKHDLGNGWSYSFFREQGSEQSTGLIIRGPAASQCMYKKVFDDGTCGGSLHFTNSLIAQREGRPMWTVESREPLTLSPSIKCKCEGQHGHIRNGVYV